MAKELKMVPKRSRYYKKYRTLKQLGPIIFPNPYQSMLIYYNELNAFTDFSSPAGFFCGAYRVQRHQAHVNLRAYFSQYRVEKVTVTLQFSEIANQNQCLMATTHSADGATTGASTPTITTIRSYADCQMYQVGQNCPKKVWRFSVNDPNEYNYRDILAAVTTNDDEYQNGGVQWFCTQTTNAAAQTSITALMKYKIRYVGKQSIAI